MWHGLSLEYFYDADLVKTNPHGNRPEPLLSAWCKTDQGSGGVHDGCLKISLQAPALENKANEHLLAWLAKQLKIPQKQIQFLSGQNSRKRRLEIWGSIDAEQITQLLKP